MYVETKRDFVFYRNAKGLLRIYCASDGSNGSPAHTHTPDSFPFHFIFSLVSFVLHYASCVLPLFSFALVFFFSLSMKRLYVL